MTQYKLLKPISTPNGSVEVGEKTIALIDTVIPALKKLVWNNYTSEVVQISELIKDGWIEEVKPVEYNENGSI